MLEHQYPAALRELLTLTQARSLLPEIKQQRFSLLLAEHQAELASLNIITITGTNGKGSVCAMLASCLQAAGLQVGVFSSPHLFAINERIVINAQQVDDACLATHCTRILDDLQSFISRHGSAMMPAFFEILILLALRIYAEAGVQWAIFEAGIGGRSDATHMLPSQLSAITTVGLDHMDILGASTAEIAADKAGIATPGSLLFLGPQLCCDANDLQHYPAYASIVEVCAKRQVRIIHSTPDTEIIAQHKNGTELAIHLDELGTQVCKLALPGAHQVDNCKLVASILAHLVRQGMLASINALQAVQGTRWAGRMEYLAGAPSWLFDVAHNAHAFAILTQSLASFAPYAERVLIYGASKEKDYAPCIALLPSLAPQIHLVSGFNKALGLAELRQQMPVDAQIAGEFADIAQCIADISRHYAGQQRCIIVLGSLYLVGLARQQVYALPPQVI